MAKAKIAVTISDDLVDQIDRLVKSKEYANRSQAIEEAVMEKLMKIYGTRLAAEAAKLDSKEEKELAEAGMEGNSKKWTQY